MELLFNTVRSQKLYTGSSQVDFDPGKSADHRKNTFTLDVGWQISNQFRLDLNLPYVQINTSNEDRTPNDTGVRGLGDTSLLLNWAPWEDSYPKDKEGNTLPYEHTFLDNHNLSFLFGLKFPTGDDKVGNDGTAGSEFRILGSGTTDVQLGAVYNAPILKNLFVFDSFIWDIPLGETTQLGGTRPGQSITNRLGLAYSPWDPLSLFLSLDMTWVDRTRLASSGILNSSGGGYISLTPGVAFDFLKNFGAEIFVSIPIFRNAYGTQLVSDESWTFGLYAKF